LDADGISAIIIMEIIDESGNIDWDSEDTMRIIQDKESEK